jgi:hypothetical protein
MSSPQSLLQLIKQLGGDKTDLDLIKNVQDEDEEIEAQVLSDLNEKSLMKDLKNFIKQLNIPAPPESIDSEEEDGQENDEHSLEKTSKSEPIVFPEASKPLSKKLVFLFDVSYFGMKCGIKLIYHSLSRIR